LQINTRSSKKFGLVRLTASEKGRLEKAIEVCDALAVHAGGDLADTGSKTSHQLRELLEAVAVAETPLLKASPDDTAPPA
jgi:hypothetical protein